MATTVKCKIILFDDVLHSSLFSLENDHNSQQIISLKDIIEYYVYYTYTTSVCTHKMVRNSSSSWRSSVFLAVGEYHLSSHNSIVLLYSMSIFYHQTTALSAMC